MVGWGQKTVGMDGGVNGGGGWTAVGANCGANSGWEGTVGGGCRWAGGWGQMAVGADSGVNGGGRMLVVGVDSGGPQLLLPVSSHR